MGWWSTRSSTHSAIASTHVCCTWMYECRGRQDAGSGPFEPLDFIAHLAASGSRAHAPTWCATTDCSHPYARRVHCTWKCRCREAQGRDCSCNPPAFPPLHMDVQVPQSTWIVREWPSMAVRCARAAIHGGQMKVTIPVWAPRPGPGSAQRMMALDKARVIISRTRVSHWGRAENTKRSGQGNDTTHWRMGTRGRPWSTKWAALSTIRRAAYEGQNPLRLQMNGTRCPWWYPSHCSP